MEEPPYILTVLARYKVRDIESFPILYGHLGGDSLLAGTLLFIVNGIENTEDGVRHNISQISRGTLDLTTVEDRLARKKARGEYQPGERTLVHRYFAGQSVPQVIRFCGYALFEICNMWDSTANLLRCLYDVKVDEKECRFPDIYNFLKSERELAPFFEGLEIRLDKTGMAFFSEDSSMIKLIGPRNRVAHSLTFSSVAADLKAGVELKKILFFLYDPCRENGKRVRVLTFHEWKDLVARSYSHFVTNYSELLEILEKRTERIGGLRNEK
ncbi:hypothetical protein HYT57_03795 [Candidatus Woesearchaeota archaeon]|nr:hypothetical protein [Candidatus Woesearchaeota archaeon]